MTAVLHATDALRKDRTMASLDDINYSPSTDWKAKYFEVADMLAETRAELDDFHHSSKELEEELERELERTEKAQQDLKIKVAKAEQERDEWKSKFMSLQTTHNTTTTSLQRELDTLRQDHQRTKILLRDLEMGNDDLERNERAISSSLADVEGKYARALEEKILLEHELLDKANVEEESQRLKDELRDANEEISILKDQLAAANAQIRPTTLNAPSDPSLLSVTQRSSQPSLSDEDLLSITTPTDLQLADISPSFEAVEPRVAKKIEMSPERKSPTRASPERRPPSVATSGTPSGQLASLYRAGFQPPRTGTSTPSNTRMTRSHTLTASPVRMPPPKTVISRPTPSRSTSVLSTSTASTQSKSKGVQMVSDMRARVKVLEQKLHTRVPRLRMPSVTSRTAANSIPPPKAGPSSASASPAPSTSSSVRSNSVDDRTSKTRRPSLDLGGAVKRTPAADQSGWVLIMEDSPTPSKDREKERRHNPSPSAPSAFRPVSYTSDSPYASSVSRPASALSQSMMPVSSRRPLSRLSISTEGRSSVSTNATTSTISSIPTPSSRPSTPTFLPIPTSGMYASGAGGLKLSTGPSSGAYSQPKRSSLGASTARSPSTASGLPTSSSNVTLRPSSNSKIALGQSRIGRPANTGASGRKSHGEGDDGFGNANLTAGDKGRTRSASSTALYGRNGL